MIPGLFLSGTSTAVGKTFVARGLARALVRAGRRPAAIKPIETGVDPTPLDAVALSRACSLPQLADAPGLFRARFPLAPYAATLEGSPPPPSAAELAARVRDLAERAAADTLLVEGAGGLLVPLDATSTVAELAAALALPLALVARDELGVLSSVLTCVESARARRLPLAALILTARVPDPADLSPRTNARILRERVRVPVLSFPHCPDDDDALADAAERSGLLALLERTPAASPP